MLSIVLPQRCLRAVLVAGSALLALAPLAARAASPAVDNLISRLPNPDQWQKSPLESAVNEPGVNDPLVRAVQNDLRKRDIPAALRNVRILSSQYPKSAAAHYLHGVLCMATRQFFEAEGAFRQVTVLQPKKVPGWYGLGMALAMQGRYGDALAPLRRAVQEAPRNHVVVTQLGMCYLKAGRAADGEATCRQSLKIKNDFSPSWDVLGLCLRQEGKRAQALDAFDRATKTPPPNLSAWTHLAETLRASGRHAEADAANERARQMYLKAANSRRR